MLPPPANQESIVAYQIEYRRIPRMEIGLKEAHHFFMVLQKVINPEGIMEINYARGLRIVSNNEAEAYGFLQGLKNIDLKRVQSILVVGDSSTILKIMNKHHISTENSLA